MLEQINAETEETKEVETDTNNVKKEVKEE